MKSCKDCKFYERGLFSLFVINKRCRNPEVVEAELEWYPQLSKSVIFAEISRSKIGACGVEGKYWEKK